MASKTAQKEVKVRKLNNILEQGLKYQRFNLSDGEREKLWESISYTLSKEGADVAAKPSEGKVWWKKLIFWSIGAAAAAVVLGVIMFKPSVQGVTPAADGSGVVAQNSPFQPKAEPMEKTTLAIPDEEAEDRNGATTSAITTAEKESSVKESYEQETTLKEEVATSVENKDESPRDSNNTEAVGSKDEKKSSYGKKNKNTKEWEIGGNSAKRIAQDSRFSIGASSNITGRGNLSTANTNSMRAMVAELGYNQYISSSTSPQITPLSESSYSLPLNFAFSFTYKVTDRFYLGTGITYTYLHSKYDGIMDGTRFRIKQGIHFVGLPINAYYSVINRDRWNFYVNGGGTVEKGVRVNYTMETATGQTRSVSTHVKGLQYSLNTGMGVEYKLDEQGMFGLYAEPRATYYFDSKIPKSIRTDQPFQFEVQFGVRLHIK